MVFEHEKRVRLRVGGDRSIARRSAVRLRPSQVGAADRGRLGSPRRLTSDERARIKELERENRELRRANEILRKASAYFAQAELDRRPK